MAKNKNTDVKVDKKKKDKAKVEEAKAEKVKAEEIKVQKPLTEENNEPEFVTMGNDKGDTFEMMIVDEIEIEDIKYFIVVEAKEANNAECEYEIIKEVIEDGQPMLVSVDDEEEFNMVADCYDEVVASEIDYDAQM